MEKIAIENKLLLNVKEIMLYTGFGESKVRKMLNDPRSTYTVRSGAKLYANRRKLESYIEANPVID